MPSLPAAALWLGLALPGGGGDAAAAPLQILGADVPPLIYLRNERPEGFCADIVRELQRRIGDDGVLQIQPWQRVLARARQEANVLLVCPKRTEDRVAKFQWVGPLFVSRTYFYVPRDSSLRLGTLEQAKALPGVLVPRASYSHEWLNARGFANLAAASSSGPILLKMLVAGREPVLVMEETQLEALLKEAQLPADSVRPAYLAFAADSYLAFSLGTPGAVVHGWQAALAGMKRDGSFERLYRRWFDGKPPPQELLLQLQPPSGALPASAPMGHSSQRRLPY
ncbi:MAG TPA: ABC transporter substrate-binding protein [Roseateles sp.]|nr:ABC transporter substrate-binding protein [Roseateles sp.]